MSRSPVAVFFVLVACGGGSAVLDQADAMLDADLCQCPPAQHLLAEHISRYSYTSRTNGGGLGSGCGGDGYLLGLGCSVANNEPYRALIRAGFRTYEGQITSTCFWYWYNPQLRLDDITNTAICLADDLVPPAGGNGDGCDCPPVEPLLERVYRVQFSQGLAAQTHDSPSAACLEEDAIVIGGGCLLEPNPGYELEPYIKLNESGVTANEWRCSWDNATVDNSFTVTTTAVCIRPPAPGTAPEDELIADRVLYMTQEKIMPANSSLAFSAACAPGDYLISGSCTLDSTTPPGNEIALYHHGFEPGGNNPNAWRCAWHNPTDATPTARATAICLTPPTL
jgi:hypothetical protein